MAYKLENNPLFPQEKPEQDAAPAQISKKRGRPQKTERRNNYGTY